MLVTTENRYDVVDWCESIGFIRPVNGHASIWRDGREGLHIDTIYGNIWAKVGDIVMRTPWGFDVFTKKMSV
jgi:hypothetical protein